MKTSGTKPMKNTMRKPSPAKMIGSKAKEALKAAVAAKKATAATAKKATAATKASEGKPGIAVKKAAPTMQLKKAGMKKKC